MNDLVGRRLGLGEMPDPHQLEGVLRPGQEAREPPVP